MAFSFRTEHKHSNSYYTTVLGNYRVQLTIGSSPLLSINSDIDGVREDLSAHIVIPLVSDCCDRLVDPLLKRVAKDTIDVNIESLRFGLDDDRNRLALLEESLAGNDFFGSPATSGSARVEDDRVADTSEGDVEKIVTLDRGNIKVSEY